MAVRNIVTEGDEILRKISKPILNFDKDLHELLDDMWDSLNARKGMGLAAVQIGVLKRIFIVDINNMKMEFVNPIITNEIGTQCKEEGCLSVPKLRGEVIRPEKVVVNAQDRFGVPFCFACEDDYARCVSHETDHLKGVLFIDKIKKVTYKNGNEK